MQGKDASINSYKVALDTFDKRKVNLNLPTIKISDEKIDLIKIIRMFNFCKSNSEVRRLIRSNAIKIDDKLIMDENFYLYKNVNLHPIKISVGKKRHGILIFK